MSKQQSLNKLLTMSRDDARNIGILEKERRMLLDCVENLRDFKRNIEYYANFCKCIQSQLHNTIQYHHGNRHFMTRSDVQCIWTAMQSMCKVVGYELYSPNGAWFVRAIK
jgi:meiotically up-regulated gene 157 (Mug157) protein